MLDALPFELLLQVLSHLPHHPSDCLPRSALIPIISVSRHFHTALSPVLVSEIGFRTPAQLSQFLARRSVEPARSKSDSVKSIVFHAPTRGTDWSDPDLCRIFRDPEISEGGGAAPTRIKICFGTTTSHVVESVLILLDQLGEATDSPISLSCTDADQNASSCFRYLRSLSLIFPSSTASVDVFTDSSEGEKASPSTTTPLSSPPERRPFTFLERVTHLEIGNAVLSDSTLLALVQSAPQLSTLTLSDCTGYSSSALSTCLHVLQSTLRSLTLTAPSPVPPPSYFLSSPSPPSPISVSPRHYSPFPPSRYSALDLSPLLSLRLLTSLTLSATLCPTPSPLLPLFQGSTRLPLLHHLAILNGASIWKDDSLSVELFSAIMSLSGQPEVEVEGDCWDKLRGRLKWATEVAGRIKMGAKEAVEIGKEIEGSGRKRRRPGMRMSV